MESLWLASIGVRRCSMRRVEMNGTVAWLVFALLIAALASGCHGDTNQGGGAEKGHAAPGGTPQQVQQPVPTPPTADQVAPSSPRAVLGGTSTTQPVAQGTTGQPKPEPHE